MTNLTGILFVYYTYIVVCLVSLSRMHQETHAGRRLNCMYIKCSYIGRYRIDVVKCVIHHILTKGSSVFCSKVVFYGHKGDCYLVK